MGVLLVDDLFNGGWNEDITLFIHEVLTFVRFGSGETDDGLVFVAVIFQSLKRAKHINYKLFDTIYFLLNKLCVLL